MKLPNTDNTNLAYDLSRFDTADRDKQVEQHRKQSSAEIKMNERCVSRSGSAFKIAMVSILVFGALCVVNVNNTMVDDWSRKVSEQSAELTAAQEKNAMLQSKLDSIANIGYIESYAAQQLGMAKVTNSQIKYLGMNTESLIEVTPDKPDNIFMNIKGWFEDLLEYIGF